MAHGRTQFPFRMPAGTASAISTSSQYNAPIPVNYGLVAHQTLVPLPTPASCVDPLWDPTQLVIGVFQMAYAGVLPSEMAAQIG